MLQLTGINSRLSTLKEEFEKLHIQIVPEDSTELSQAAKTTEENVTGLGQKIIEDYHRLDDELDGIAPAESKEE